MNKRLVMLLRQKFYARLEAKTGWGRIELKQQFEEALTEALAELADELEKGD